MGELKYTGTIEIINPKAESLDEETLDSAIEKFNYYRYTLKYKKPIAVGAAASDMGIETRILAKAMKKRKDDKTITSESDKDREKRAVESVDAWTDEGR